MVNAALNMLTRTSTEYLAQNSHIYMNSVDTGWINDEHPLQKASKISKTNLFQTLIDEIDAANIILASIFSGTAIDQQKQQNNNDDCTENDTKKNNKKDEKIKKPFGKFFKDYRKTEC